MPAAPVFLRQKSILCSRLSESGLSFRSLIWVSMPLARTDAVFYSDPHHTHRCPRGSPKKTGLNITFFMKLWCRRKINSKMTLWFVLPKFKIPIPKTVYRFQIYEPFHSKCPTGCKIPFHDDPNTVHLYCAHRILSTFIYIFSLHSHSLGCSQGHYYCLHFMYKKIDSLESCSLT